MKKAVIFDMDGLMIDSERTTYNCYVEKLHELGHDDFTEELYTQCLGKKKPGICQVFIDYYGEDFPMVEVWDDCHVMLDDTLRKHVPKKKGLDELLKYLKDNNYKTIVATSSARSRVDEILANANITEYFDDSICGDEVTHGKPNPEIFLTACEKLGVSKEEAIVLEDSEAGVLAAHNGDIDCICIPDMKYPEPEYEKLPIRICDSLLDVIDYLEDVSK
ncbi:MAG: HAD family phosphatase [Erysipelotrichaceae bacterium]|nr:HAD family phosphatase [Erysipelotrichaceae bacterium]